MGRLWALSGKMGSGKSTVARALLSSGGGGNVVSLAMALKKMVAKHMSISPVLPYCLSNEFKQLPVTPTSWSPLAMEELPRPIVCSGVDVAHVLGEVNVAICEWIKEGGRPYPRSCCGCEPPTVTVTVGALLQHVGQTFRTFVEPMYWVRALESSDEWRGAMACGKDVVIDDLRYANEFVWFSEFMGATVVRVVAGDDTAAQRAVAGRLTDHVSEIGLDGCDFPITVVTDPGESDASLGSRVLQAAAFLDRLSDSCRLRPTLTTCSVKRKS